jgi:uncharacterized protein
VTLIVFADRHTLGFMDHARSAARCGRLWRSHGSRLLASGIAEPRHTGVVRITVRVRPGSARTRVGGEHEGALVVRVTARAVGGQATAAALAAVAEAFGVRRQAVTLVAGAATRTKIIDVADADPAVLDQLLAL